MESEEKPIIPQKGTEYPVLKYLYKYVKVDIATDWYEIGVELFDAGDEIVLNTISENHSKDVNKCAGEMLKLWIARNPDATWNQLIKALKEPHIKLNTVAKKIASMLSKDSSTVPQDRKRRGDETSDPEQFSLSTAKKTKMADQSDDGDIEIDFTKCNVVIAFTELMAILQDNTPECRLPAIKARCITFTEAKFGERIDKQADNVDNFFKLLSQSYIYCNWLNFSLVEIIISALRNKKLKSLMNSYKEAIYSKTLGEVWKYIPQEKVNNKYYSEVTKTFTSKNPDDVTVKELIEFSQQLAYKIAPLVKVIANCLTIISLVPANKAYQLFLSMLTVPQESRQEDFLQIGTWVVHHPKSVLQKLRIEFAIASYLTLLIGYYHGVLLKGINADLLFEDMCLKGLLNADQQSLISSGHSVHYRNWLLLEYIRCMEADIFLVFCELVQNLWLEVGSQLIYVFNTIPGIQEDSTKDLTKAQVISHQLHLYFQPSSVHIAFLCLIDQLHILLQHSDIEIFISLCENMMASTFEQENIKLFSDTQIAKLKESKTTLMMLWRLNFFFTWSNHSILRMLVSEDFSIALQLLDVFDSRVDPLLSIASYPIPYFSCDMIPVDTSAHTILAIRCGQRLYECTLQYVYDMQSVMMEKCLITQHCLQLLAVRNDPAILYWTIPKCVVNLISNQVPCHSEYLYSKGVLEVLIYPELSLSTGDDIKIGSLGFITENDVSNEEHDNTEQMIEQLKKNIESDKANKIALEKDFEEVSLALQRKEENLQSVAKSIKKVQVKMTQTKLEKDQLDQKTKQLNLEIDKKNQLISELLKKLEKQNEQLKSKLPEVTKEKDQLIQQIEQLNLKIEKQNQSSRQNNELNLELRKKLKKQDEVLNSKILEITRKKGIPYSFSVPNLCTATLQQGIPHSSSVPNLCTATLQQSGEEDIIQYIAPKAQPVMETITGLQCQFSEFPLDQTILTPGQDGCYLEDRDYHVVRHAGTGGSATCSLGCDKIKISQFVIKRQNNSFSKEEKENVIRESRLLKEIDHDNVIRFYGLVEDLADHCFKMFLEFADETCGDIHFIFCECDDRESFSGNIALIMLYVQQILFAVDYLHREAAILHLNIKGKNIVVCNGGYRVKLIGFGKACKIIGAQSKKYGWTPVFAAPEVNNQSNNLKPSVDIWSVMCVAVEMVTGAMPWPKVTSEFKAIFKVGNYVDHQITELIQYDEYQEKYNDHPDHYDMYQELVWMWQWVFRRDSSSRPAANQLLSLKWMREMELNGESILYEMVSGEQSCVEESYPVENVTVGIQINQVPIDYPSPGYNKDSLSAHSFSQPSLLKKILKFFLKRQLENKTRRFKS